MAPQLAEGRVRENAGQRSPGSPHTLARPLAPISRRS